MARTSNEHIKQNDSRCLEKIQKIGCFVRSCGLVAEYKTGKKLTVEQVNEMWNEGVEEGIINSKDDLVNPAAMITKALRKLGDSGKYVEVGTIRNGVMSLYHWVNVDLYPDAFIKKISQGGPSKYHFVLSNEVGETVEDPHDPPIYELGVEYIICYRYRKG